MKSLYKAYAQLCDLLQNPSVLSSPSASFSSLCKRAGAAPADLGSLVREELGMDGDTLFLIFKQKSLNL